MCVYDLPPPPPRSALGCYLTWDRGNGDRGKQQGGSGQVRVVPNTLGKCRRAQDGYPSVLSAPRLGLPNKQGHWSEFQIHMIDL